MSGISPASGLPFSVLVTAGCSSSALRRSANIVFFFQAEDGIRDGRVTGVQTCALPILVGCRGPYRGGRLARMTVPNSPSQAGGCPAPAAPASPAPASTPSPGPGPGPGLGWGSWVRRWPLWAPRAAAVWGAVYAVVQVLWWAAGTTVPWKPHEATPAWVLLGSGVLAVAAGTAGVAAAGVRARRGRRAVAVVLAVALPVFAVGMASVPEYVVTLASASGVESATGLCWVGLNAVGTGLLAAVAVSLRRSWAGRCPRCGRRHGGDRYGVLVRP